MGGTNTLVRRCRWRTTPAALMYAMVLPAGVVIYVAGRLGVMAAHPPWVIAGVLGGAALTGSLADLWVRHRPSRRWVHVHVALHSLGVTPVIYLTGWGPALSAAYVALAQESVAAHGAASWWMPALWSGLAIAAGEVAVAAGLAPSMLSAPAAHAVAATSAGAVAFAIRVVGVAFAQKEQAEDAVRHQALHDALTGLPNRSLLLDRLTQALARAERAGTEVAVIFCDLDRFKLVNDSLGHDVGDRVLCAVARRLERTVRPGDTVARFGGDEFVILCEGLERATDVAGIAERIQGALGEPIEVAGEEFYASASMGVALGSCAEGGAESLIRDADAAMYRAKEQGRGRFEIFDPDTRAETLRRLHTETALRRALERGELCLHYQPVVDLASGEVRSVEALVRWRHPERGLLLPGEFIPVAEDSGLIVALGEWVLLEAGRQARTWRATGGAAGRLQVAVNLSPRQLFECDIVATVARAMQVSGLRAGQLALCLEVTEHMVMDSPERAEAVLWGLKELGVQLAIDDFGTGYSSLAYLSRFPIDMLKIDRSFICGLDANPDHQAIVAAIIQLARALGLEAIAEGVETEAEAAVLRRLGCPRVQGFHYARPVPPDEIGRLLAARRLERQVAAEATVAPVWSSCGPGGAPGGGPRQP